MEGKREESLSRVASAHKRETQCTSEEDPVTMSLPAAKHAVYNVFLAPAGSALGATTLPHFKTQVLLESNG